MKPRRFKARRQHNVPRYPAPLGRHVQARFDGLSFAGAGLCRRTPTSAIRKADARHSFGSGWRQGYSLFGRRFYFNNKEAA
jgi:hypothetical protein